MGGGLIQVFANDGPQDLHLTGNPDITFFKVVYKRHTNFAIESVTHQLDGSFNSGGKSFLNIPRDGDLLYKLYLEWNPSEVLKNLQNNKIIASNLGYNMIDYAEILIGGVRIDRHHGHWMNIYNSLTEYNPEGTFNSYSDSTKLTEPDESTITQSLSFNYKGIQTHGSNTITAEDVPKRAYIPFKFWFCKSTGLALPLIALQYHTVTLNIKYNNFENIFQDGAITGNNISLNGNRIVAEYIYLDEEERRKFAKDSHEYLMEQVQFETKETSKYETLVFNNPVKELIWCGTPTPLISAINHGTSNPNPICTGNWELKLNNHSRFPKRDYRYFTRTQIYQYHTGYGSIENNDSIAVYSFALSPEKHQPSGTCNFSRINTAILSCDGAGASNSPINVYAINYNVLRVINGMGGLGYSN